MSASYVAGKAYDTSEIYMRGTSDDVKAYGAYTDIRYETDYITVGLDAKYFSYDKKYGFFSTGGDLDRMYIMDDIMGITGVCLLPLHSAYLRPNQLAKNSK